MAAPSDQHEHTIAFAEIALQQIRALRQPALPRNFEIWYQYATGYSPELNGAINQMLAQKISLSDADSTRFTRPTWRPIVPTSASTLSARA